MSKGKTPVYTMSSIAKSAGISAKGARAKFRRMTKERPFNHKTVKTITPVMAKKAVAFLKADYRAAN